MLGIVIPAHNEEQFIRACLAATRLSAQHPDLGGEPVETIVALDDCSDATGVLAACCGAMTVSIRARNVGMARAAGAEALLARGARWLAFTDADTVVAPDWLATQLALGTDVVCGTVGVQDWSPHGGNAACCNGISSRPIPIKTAIGTCTAPTWVCPRRRTAASAGFVTSPAAKTPRWCRRWSTPATPCRGARCPAW
jgi:glycosyltransferase involved in cell wall biosynthesis